MKRKVCLIAVLLALLAGWMTVAPPRVLINLVKRVDLADPVAAGSDLVERYECRDCHRIQSSGALIAPNLNGVATRLGSEELRAWMRDPDGVRPGTAMPNFHLSDSEIEALAAFLRRLPPER